jgi:hypothetical protein
LSNKQNKNITTKHYFFFYKKQDKQTESPKNLKYDNIENVQAWCDLACSWTVLKNENYRPQPLASA